MYKKHYEFTGLLIGNFICRILIVGILLLLCTTPCFADTPEEEFYTIPQPSIFSSPFDIMHDYHESRQFIQIKSLAYILDTSVFWDNDSKESMLLLPNVSIIISLRENTLIINDEVYEYSSAPYIKENSLFISIEETCNFMAEYIVNNNAFFDFFSDLGGESIRDHYNFPSLIFYQGESISSIPIQSSLDDVETHFQGLLKVSQDKYGYYTFKIPGFSGKYYPDGQFMVGCTITSNDFFTDRFITIGSTKDEVLSHYGYPYISPSDDRSDSNDIWRTLWSAEGKGITFYFHNNKVIKITIGDP